MRAHTDNLETASCVLCAVLWCESHFVSHSPFHLSFNNTSFFVRFFAPGDLFFSVSFSIICSRGFYHFAWIKVDLLFIFHIRIESNCSVAADVDVAIFLFYCSFCECEMDGDQSFFACIRDNRR